MPCVTRPPATVPTPGTSKSSSTWNSGSSCSSLLASTCPTPGGSRWRNCFTLSNPVPSTLDTQKIGTILFLSWFEAAVIQSSLDLTTRGTLLAPADLRMVATVDRVALSLGAGTMSTLVTTTKKGHLQGYSNAKVLLSHPNNSGTSRDHQHH